MRAGIFFPSVVYVKSGKNHFFPYFLSQVFVSICFFRSLEVKRAWGRFAKPKGLWRMRVAFPPVSLS